MITLTTGTPGAGKTLWTIVHVEALRQSTGREVYYSGISDLNLPWLRFDDAAAWHTLPDGVIIVIDEAQRVFRPAGIGQKVPDEIAAFETHRHRGHDVFLITQQPGLIHSNIRKLTEVHRHLMRKFGSTWATVHEWAGVRDNCDKTRKDSIATQWRYPKHAYGWYKSAEVHTHKLRVPFKVWLALLVPVFIVGGAWWFYSKRLSPDANQAPKTDSKTVVSGVPSAPSVGGGKLPATTFDLASFQPRVADLPHSAPRYDGMTQPVRVPVIVGCVTYWPSKDGFCITQQGTRVYPSQAFRLSFNENGGYFLDFDPEPRSEASGASARPPDKQTAERAQWGP